MGWLVLGMLCERLTVSEDDNQVARELSFVRTVCVHLTLLIVGINSLR
jgi:hypothetical protein